MKEHIREIYISLLKRNYTVYACFRSPDDYEYIIDLRVSYYFAFDRHFLRPRELECKEI